MVPLERNVPMCSLTDGWFHIPPSMAGATISGHSAVRSMVESRSSHSPSAALARQLAVAGAITMASACSGNDKCFIS